MLEMKDAVNRAKDYLRQIYNESPLENMRLEEIQREGDTWYITLGFDDFEATPPPFSNFGVRKRNYKTIQINAEGEFEAMKMREV